MWYQVVVCLQVVSKQIKLFIQELENAILFFSAMQGKLFTILFYLHSVNM